MPNVGGKKYPYTPRGMAMARRAARPRPTARPTARPMARPMARRANPMMARRARPMRGIGRV
jgi:hypothetical protein